jgi:hypothetical protein
MASLRELHAVNSWECLYWFDKSMYGDLAGEDGLLETTVFQKLKGGVKRAL